MTLKFALIKERKIPTDNRVVFSPSQLREVQKQFPQARFVVEPSSNRLFSDAAYQDAGFQVTSKLLDCDVLLGIKEVPVDVLIPNKRYCFFSHTIKKQACNRELLRAIIDNNITLYDYEALVDKQGRRFIGFGRLAGLVGAYQGFRLWGLKYMSWWLPCPQSLSCEQALVETLKQIKLPNIKILMTGHGKVASGAQELLDALAIKQVTVAKYLNTTFTTPVYCKLDILDYYIRKDGCLKNTADFFENPQDYRSIFMTFASLTDLYIAGHFYNLGAPSFYTHKDVKSPHFNIKVVADISCDVQGPIATTLRTTTLDNPFYGYDPKTSKETHYKNKQSIAVMAVDNLPNALPREASEDFGQQFFKQVFPSFFNADENGVLSRAKITEKGALTEPFRYLSSFVNSH